MFCHKSTDTSKIRYDGFVPCLFNPFIHCKDHGRKNCVAYKYAVQALYNIVPFLNAVDIDPYVMYIIAGYAIVGALFGLFGGSISIGKYLTNEGENAVA